MKNKKVSKKRHSIQSEIAILKAKRVKIHKRKYRNK
jgi:hypothetical protein